MTRPRPSPKPAPPEPTVRVFGLAVTILGGALVLVSITALKWYGTTAQADSAGALKFSDLKALTKLLGGPALSKSYFEWLAWVALILVVVLGLVGSLPVRAALPAGVAGAVVGLAGAVFTYLAMSKFLSAVDAHLGVFQHARIGLWLTLIGFVVAAVGAALGLVKPRV